MYVYIYMCVYIYIYIYTHICPMSGTRNQQRQHTYVRAQLLQASKQTWHHQRPRSWVVLELNVRTIYNQHQDEDIKICKSVIGSVMQI